jgi:nitrous oxide reductase
LHDESADKREVLIEEMQDLKDEKFLLKITTTKERAIPKLPWINIVLADDIKMRFVDENAQPTATFNLYDFKNNLMTIQQLKSEIENVFGIYHTEYKITTSDEKELKNVTKDLAGKTLFVRRTDKGKVLTEFLNKSYPFSKFTNKSVNGKEVTVYLENPTKN